MMVVKKSSDGMVNTPFRVYRSDLAAFDAVAADRQMSRAALMRECMLEKTAEHNRKKQMEQ